MTKSVQPYKNPVSGPRASRRKTYWPPARGYIAASSPYARAPNIVTIPATTQASSSHSGEPTVRPMSAETMKMPEPIIDPATSIVASVRVIALTNPRLESFVVVWVSGVTQIPLCEGRAHGLFVRVRGRGKLLRDSILCQTNYGLKNKMPGVGGRAADRMTECPVLAAELRTE